MLRQRLMKISNCSHAVARRALSGRSARGLVGQRPAHVSQAQVEARSDLVFVFVFAGAGVLPYRFCADSGDRRLAEAALGVDDNGGSLIEPLPV
jgi:hypothetical protein